MGKIRAKAFDLQLGMGSEATSEFANTPKGKLNINFNLLLDAMGERAILLSKLSEQIFLNRTIVVCPKKKCVPQEGISMCSNNV